MENSIRVNDVNIYNVVEEVLKPGIRVIYMYCRYYCNIIITEYFIVIPTTLHIYKVFAQY